jgi:hypothetical protein
MKYLQHLREYRAAISQQMTRRDALAKIGAGMGTIGLAGMMGQGTLSGATGSSPNPLAPKEPHFPAKAKRIIQLFMPGGPSQVDTFDYKPMLAKHAGERPSIVDRKTLRNTKLGLMPSPFGFKRYGECGKMVSDIFPETAQCVDDISFIHSMHTNIPEHAGGILMTNLGALQANRPSMGAWLTYGLGADTDNLPGFVAMSPVAQPRGKIANWGNSFLPGAYAGSYVNIGQMKPEAILSDLKNSSLGREDQRKQVDLLATLNRIHLHRLQQDQQLEAGIQAMEMAFRMQFSVPDVFDVTKESEATRKLYGDSHFAKGCLIARRLVERGVRVVQLSHSISGYDIAWDTGHGNIVDGHRDLAKACDQGIAALLKDLKSRGMLEDTLVVWGGEFGRAPTSEGAKGRDHDHYGYTVWMAGGGVKAGFTYGATDEFGCSAVENRVHVHDLHATILHLMGLDHKKLTYRYSGRDYRLTDVHGQVVHDVIA